MLAQSAKRSERGRRRIMVELSCKFLLDGVGLMRGLTKMSRSQCIGAQDSRGYGRVRGRRRATVA